MKLKILASGSAANSYILEGDNEKLLIEAGLPFKEILQGLNFDLKGVVGCLCSHLHKDHSRSIKEIMQAGIDVYSHESVFDEQLLKGHRKHAVNEHQTLTIGNEWEALSFPMEHDTPGYGYLIRHKPDGFKTLFLTDSFYCKYKFSKLNAICIECNYILETLDRNIELGLIPEEMKPRLLRSHFSLENVLNFLRATDLSECASIVLLHLSANNADSKIMIEQVEKLTGITPVIADSGVEVDLNVFPY